MALRDTWHRTLMYFGLADDEDYEDDLEPYNEPEVEAQDAYATARTCAASARGAGATNSTTSSPTIPRPTVARPRCGP